MSGQPLPGGKSTTEEAAKLTSRRKKMQAAKSTAAAATANVVNLEARLESLTLRRRQQKAELREVKNRESALEKAIKAAGKQRKMLRESVKVARKAATRAERNAHQIESKYDQAVLADLVRQEKQSDLSTHSARTASPDTRPALDEPPRAAVAAIETAPVQQANTARSS